MSWSDPRLPGIAIPGVLHGDEDRPRVDLAASEATHRPRVLEHLGPRVEEGLDLAEHPVGGVQARPHRGLEADQEPAHVLGGDELAAQEPHDAQGEDEEADRGQHDPGPVVERGLQPAEVGAGEPDEREVHLPADLPPLAHLEEARAAHGSEGEGLQEGDQHRHRDGDPELEEELPDDPLHEGHGQEDGHDGEGGGGGGEGDLARAHRGGPDLPLSVLAVPVDVLEDHDRVVDHDPHHQGEAEHGEGVQGACKVRRLV